MRKLTILILLLITVTSNAASLTGDEGMKKNLVGSWKYTPKSTVVFYDNGEFKEYNGDFKVQSVQFGKLPNPKDVSIPLSEGEWYVTGGQLKKLHMKADGQTLSMAKRMYQTCDIKSMSKDEFKCYTILGQSTTTWRRSKQ